MSITSISPFSTTATTSYETYLLKQEQLASNTNETNYLRLLNAPPRVVQPPSSTLNQQLSSAETIGGNTVPSSTAGLNDAFNTAASSVNSANNGLNGSLFSALAAQFDVKSQLFNQQNDQTT